MMTPERLEQLRRQYAGKRVAVDGNRPELARWANVPGRVVSVNGNGRCLVQFDEADPSWHDIHPEFIKLEPLEKGD
jgi:hypothetical protein